MQKKILYLVPVVLILAICLAPMILDGMAGPGPAAEPDENAGPASPAASKEGETTGEEQDATGNGDVLSAPEEPDKEPAAGGDVTQPAAPPSSSPAETEQPHVEIRLTADWGTLKVAERRVPFQPGESVLEAMKKHFTVETAYGGGFINSIEGLDSGYTGKTGTGREKKDWFYWINGVMSGTGAYSYQVRDGEVIWWDYQDWSSTMFIPAVVGAYPEPFLHGYDGKGRGATVLYTPGLEAEAGRVKNALEGQKVQPVTVGVFSQEAVAGRSRPVMVVGPWPEIKESEMIRSLLERGPKAGLYVRFTGDGGEMLTPSGSTARSFGPGTGVILAVGTQTSDPRVIWLLSGPDQEGVKRAVRLLSEQPQELRSRFGVVVEGQRVQPLPVK